MTSPHGHARRLSLTLCARRTVCADYKAMFMGTNFETHDKDCLIQYCTWPWCCGGGTPFFYALVLGSSAENYMVMTRFKAFQNSNPLQTQMVQLMSQA